MSLDNPESPTEALEGSIQAATLLDRFHHSGKDSKRPGAVIQYMPERIRELLKKLRSSDIEKVPWLMQAYAFWGAYEAKEAKESFSQLMMKFDRLLQRKAPKWKIHD